MFGPLLLLVLLQLRVRLLLLLFLPPFSYQFLSPNSSSSPASPRCPSRCSCAHSTVICAGLALSHVPRDIPPGTTRLDLQENAIRQLRPGDFDGLSALRTLHIGDNSIEHIEKSSFDALPSLERVRLSRNKIRTLPEGVFANNKRLRRLDLSENALWSLSAEHLAGPAHLSSLQLDHNQLQCVDPLAFSQWHSLESLSLASNALSSLSPLDLMAMPNLRTLRLSDNPWHCDCRLRWLKRLKIAAQIRCYRPTHLFGRPLNQISSQLKCSGLEKRASGGVRKCRDTERCPPGCVCTESAPDAVVVDCHDRLLRAVPQRLPSNTVELRLEQNRLSHLENGSFSHVPNLIRLDLSKNAIKRVEPNAFAGLRRLSSLMLFSNNLTDLPERVFDGIGNSLQVLLLNGNQLECLRDEVFRGLDQLKLLSLYDNKIRSISQASFAPFAHSLQTLHLARNPLICDCNLAWMAQLFAERPIETSGARCLSPKRVAQKRIATLYAERFRCVGAESLVTHGAGQCEVDRECPEECQCRGTTVDCSSLRLTSLPPSAFPRFTTSLLLRSNRLSPQGPFLPDGDLPNLVHLDLSDNQISALPMDFLSSVSSLRELDLSENSLRQFSAHSLGPSALSLITLQLDGNALRCLPLGQFPSLRSLSLRQNPLISLDGPVMDQVELLGLDGSAHFICDCQLRPLIRRMRKMGRIWTDEWKGEAFGGPRCAEPENLRGKGLAELEEDELICGDGVPAGQCSTEGEFCPSGCRCVRQPAASAARLIMRCSGLGLTRLPLGIPEDVSELFLDNNRIELLSGDAFVRLAHLTKLDLSHNFIRHIPSGTFSSLSLLSTLILAFNRIQCLHNGAFDGLSQLRVLSLHQNDLSQLSQMAFAPLLANLSHVALSANPFWCDCQMNWAIRWFRSKFVEPGIAKCEGPPDRKGLLLLSADPLMECHSAVSLPPSAVTAPLKVLSKCHPCLDRSLCANFATCHPLENGQFRCECPPGFRGTFCEHSMNNCETTNKGEQCERSKETTAQSMALIGPNLAPERKAREGKEEKGRREEKENGEGIEEFESAQQLTGSGELSMPRKRCPFAFAGPNCTQRRAVGLSQPNAFVRLGEWEENGRREVAMVLRSSQRSGAVLFAGDPSSAFVLLELVHGRLRAAVQLAPANSPPAQLFSPTNVDDGLPHSIHLSLHGRRLLLLLDSFPALSVLNVGPVQVFSAHSVPLFIGGVPIELGRRALVNFCLSDISSIRGCFSDIRINHRPFDLNSVVPSHNQSLSSPSLFGCSEAVDLCAGKKCEGKRRKCRADEKESEGWKCVEEEEEKEKEEKETEKDKEEEEEEEKEEEEHNWKHKKPKREERVGRRCSRGRGLMRRDAFWVEEGCRSVHYLPFCAGNCAGNDGHCCVALQKRKRRARVICGEGEEAKQRWRMVEVPRKCGCSDECRKR